jgi:hypothetical protein
MADQPEPLRLADFLDDQYDPSHNLEEAADELRRLHQFERGYNEWTEKTQWVQETKQTYELGMHRADVLKQRIEKLKAVNQELLAALNNIEVSTHDAMTAALARAAIAKAEAQP